MHTYRRLASTASSTSRSASTSFQHGPSHTLPNPNSHSSSRLSRSGSSTSSTVISPAMTPVEPPASFGRMALPSSTAASTGNSRGLSSPTSTRNTSFASPPTTEQYTRAELETIAESLLAHVHFGPYHLASSPVPSSHLRHAMAHRDNSSFTRDLSFPRELSFTRDSMKENSTLSTSSTSIYGVDTPSSPTPTLHPLGASNAYGGPSSRRHFEGKEGSHHPTENHHPRARFTIGGGESERGRGLGRKSVGLSVRDVNHSGEFGSFEERGRAREGRGRSGDVKGLRHS